MRSRLWVGSYVRGEPKPLSELAETFLRETDGRRGSSEYCVGLVLSFALIAYTNSFEQIADLAGTCLWG